MSRITFYNTGLNSNNWAFDSYTHTRILTSKRIGAINTVAPVPFGAVFNITDAQYNDFKTATYLQIETADLVRYGFINNFMQLANGNWAVSYTLDDWTNFVLKGDSNVQLDGIVAQAHVPLLKYKLINEGQDNETIAPTLYNLYADSVERDSHNDNVKILNLNALPVRAHSTIEEFYQAGYVCEVYWFSEIKRQGVADGWLFTGKYEDYDVLTNNTRLFARLNTNIGFMIYDAEGWNVGVVNTQGEIVQGARSFNRRDVNSDTIIKRMVFDYLPFDTTDKFRLMSSGGTYQYFIVTSGLVKGADIVVVPTSDTSNTYYFAPSIDTFSPSKIIELTAQNIGDLVINGKEYYGEGLEWIPQAVNFKIQYLGAEVVIPATELQIGTKIITSISSDGETAIIKLSGLINQEAYNKLSATGVNDTIIDQNLKADYRAYKNAKITGALGIGATVIGSTVALGSAIATGNISGTVGALSGGASGIVQGVQKLKGLSPTKNDAGVTDETTAFALDSGLYLVATRTGGKKGEGEILEMHRNGIQVQIDLKWYIENCQMNKFNYIRCFEVEIHGAPEQVANRLSDSLYTGVTLWSDVDVGNKDVENVGYFPRNMT